jgi:hypothetical protein
MKCKICDEQIDSKPNILKAQYDREGIDVAISSNDKMLDRGFLLEFLT